VWQGGMGELGWSDGRRLMASDWVE
jgi:hypothetical protein